MPAAWRPEHLSGEGSPRLPLRIQGGVLWGFYLLQGSCKGHVSAYFSGWLKDCLKGSLRSTIRGRGWDAACCQTCNSPPSNGESHRRILKLRVHGFRV